MIAKSIEKMLSENQEHFLIPAEMVANVQENNFLDHALLVLTKVRYAKIPVLDNDYKFKGLLSLSMITETMLGLDELDVSKLHEIYVKDVMETDMPTIQDPYDIENVLHLLVDHPFLSVVSNDGSFTGIVTRRELMKSLNHIAHEFEKDYTVQEIEVKEDK
ncbi:CBS domain-containing protein [Dellaglioa algida]|uniref:CBS domain-containing protein n=1 Tax=Dellaglioa carnosa TaxID=2995136 RepID=A0ABT4JPF9_9LACO|nr:cyclic-di-AMP-binding protein CbpB [Dellaglioa carnosa]TWW12950.1 CBS domain-containing protein [Dellaglioa algida]MCZ2491871.1 CBS domain-containing protein [Dellaglioa carnosa]MCZ2492929.1 CBS domain-containing protein [Dellaglioa carnosa]MCZ2494913.1 CBS domain-containing protein [Dellaglioa carnosa]MDK1731776.1 CBS domain-containing protein [Dellaglioa carnosa]